MIYINIYPDGDQMCAIIGNIPEEIAIGFGDTTLDALEEFLSDIRAKNNICYMCLKPTNNRKQCINGAIYYCKTCDRIWDKDK